MNNSKLIKLLTYLGALPFFLAICVSFSSRTFLGIGASEWFLSYGLVILSFMAGSLWGQVVNEGVRVKRIALASNLVTLAAWFAFLLADSSIVLVIVALGFIALYVVEALAMSHVTRPDYYLSLRLRVTTLVVLAHGIMFWVV